MRRMLLAVAVATLLAARSPCARAEFPPNAGPAAAAALAQRVLGPAAAKLFEFTLLPASACDASRGPCATVRGGSASGTIAIAGSTPVEMAYALAQYCQRELLMSFTWERSGGFQTANLPAAGLPPLARPRPRLPPATHTRTRTPQHRVCRHHAKLTIAVEKTPRAHARTATRALVCTSNGRAVHPGPVSKSASHPRGRRLRHCASRRTALQGRAVRATPTT